jgi:serine/threonine protein kinase
MSRLPTQEAARSDPLRAATERLTPAAPPSRRHCPIALVRSSGPGWQDEITLLLRRRLFLAALISAGAFTTFFVLNLLRQEAQLVVSRWHIPFLGIAAAVPTFLTGLLASRLPLSLTRLRLVEGLLFGIAAVYFSWLQINALEHRLALSWARPEHAVDVFRLANLTFTMRWFGLIVVYGTFVPNTWRRCALMVALLAAIPLAINILWLPHCSELASCLSQSVVDTAVLLGIAAAVAIFGSYKISQLHQEVYEARQLGQYRLQRHLGSGGMGEVYLAEHLLLRRRCALKLIRRDQLTDPTALQRFEREVRAMARLTHWNSVEIYDYGQTQDGTFYYVMEYLPGLNLQELVQRYGPLPAGRVIHFLRQMCAALHEAHANGLIHRDIKPSNVLVTERGGVPDVIKLLDFGLVHCVRSGAADARLTQQGMILGSPPYMSPEQALGKEQVDARTDIYSLGALAYFLLTGQPPFVRETAMQVLMAHVYEAVTPPSRLRAEVPADLEAVILRCLEKDPARRFPTVEALEEALARCADASHWTRQDARAWWQQHPLTPTPSVVAEDIPSSPAPASDQLPTVAEPAPVISAPPASAGPASPE